MHGLMMHRPLLISQILEFAAGNYPDQEIVSRDPAGARPNKPRTGYLGMKVRF